jgi:Fe-Mn family superoxide dismutase
MGRARASALGPAGTDLPGFQAQEALKTMKKDGRTVYTPKSFDHLRGLTGLSDAQVTEHLDLYAGYVKQVNSLVQELSEMRAERGQTGKDFSLAEGTRRLAYEYDGMVLHELYFSNLKAGGEARPTDRQGLGRALTESYGSVEHWQENFQAIGGMRGIGWVILYEDPVNGRLINQWISLHQDGIPARWKPILVMDVWEHAFMRDYKASERAKYVEAFFKNIDWTAVDQRLRETGAIRPASAA